MRKEIAMQLRELAEEMLDLGAAMDYYGGMGEIGIHGRELIGAAKVAASWADAVEDEHDHDHTPCEPDDKLDTPRWLI